ncbi:MAG: hypothetical protein E7574_06695 [Ruminococcaceae bacterium]|nr:hypothetical protein [Oscillospiraceae bacterium]
MQFSKKKYIIKLITFFVAFFLFCVGLFIKTIHANNQTEMISKNITMTVLTSVTAGIDNLCNSFDKALLLNNFSEESKTIYANSFNIKNTLYLSDHNFINCAIWFSNLSDYAKTDMTDDQKNSDYYHKLCEARKLFISICENYSGSQSLKKIDNFFNEKKDKDYYKQKLLNSENEYAVLKKQITADHKEIDIYAKKIIDYPLAPKQFKGSYQFPKSINYSISDSYLCIFPSGKTLGRMASAINKSTFKESHNSQNDFLSKYISEYAYYITNYDNVYSYENDSLVYYIICPIFSADDSAITNYNEPIKLAISKHDYALKAFDATKYLKNHLNLFTPKTVKSTKKNIPLEIKNKNIISKKTVYINDTVFQEFKFISNDSVYFYLLNNENGNTLLFTQKEYLSYTNLI